MPLPTGKRHVSYSEVKDWSECSYRHKLKYIDKLGTFEASVHTAFGHALHAACEDYIKTRDMKPEIALDELVEQWEKYEFPDRHIWMERVNKVCAEVPGWMERAFPGWEGIDAEEDLMEDIPDFAHGNIKFKGYIDAIIKSGNYYWLIDWKTAGNGWAPQKKGDPLVQLQLIYYNLFWSRKHNIPPHKIKCAFVLLNRNEDADERCELVDLAVSEGQRRNSLVVLNNMVSAVRRQIALKAWKRAEGEYQGVCQFCDFHGTEHCPSM